MVTNQMDTVNLNYLYLIGDWIFANKIKKAKKYDDLDTFSPGPGTWIIAP